VERSRRRRAQPQRGDLTGLIPQVPRGYLARKGGKANIGNLVFQLLMRAGPSPRGAVRNIFRSAPGKTTVPISGRQPPARGAARRPFGARATRRALRPAGTREAPWPAARSGSRRSRPARRARRARHRPASEPNLTQPCARRAPRAAPGPRSPHRSEPGKRHQAIQRAAVERCQPTLPRDRTADGALARATRGRRCDDGTRRSSGHPDRFPSRAASTPKPAARAVAHEPGNEVATLATSRISRATRPQSRNRERLATR